ncbi:MAG: FAD:protein FMN transferase [Ruminococcus sp.]|nr:FAD:protein FMN transferase [Candidatus Apopatosoma intestinale]
MKKVLCALLVVLTVLFCSCATAKKRYTQTLPTVFDTFCELTAYCRSEEEFRRVADAVSGELLRLHRLFDYFNEYPDLINLKTVNETAGKEAVPVDGDFLALWTLAEELYEASDGKCNAAMGHLTALWRDCFEAGDRLPDGEAVREALSHTDPATVRVENGMVFFLDPDVRLDFGAIAKGYAGERAAEVAVSLGCTDFVLNLGGNVVVRGKKPYGAWQIGIENPDGGVETSVSLSDGAVVTSGDYLRGMDVDGVRYGHIIDPDTGSSARLWRSVTVICGDSGLADALSTALFCLDETRGRALAARYGAEVLWIPAHGHPIRTQGFAAYEGGE